MSRTRTENEYIGKLLELPVFCALNYLKQNGTIKDYTPNYPKKYGGDWDAIVLLNDGSFLDIECMNFSRKYSYNEKSSRIKDLPNRLKEARHFFGKVRKIVLVITNCLTANRGWLHRRCIEPILVEEQITEPMDETRLATFVAFLVRTLKRIIQKIEKKITLEAKRLSFLQDFVGNIKSCFNKFTRAVADGIIFL